MEVLYSTGPRYIDGINMDADVNAAVPVNKATQEISDPVTGVCGKGYEPGQLNKDGSDL